MPMYDFECQGCGKRFTDLTSFDRRDEMPCPECHSATRVLIASFAVKSGGRAEPSPRAVAPAPKGGC